MRPFSTRGSACTRATRYICPKRFYNLQPRRPFSDKKGPGDPLRILFCGSDAFSTTSLRALHEYSQTPESNILSIDVVTKTDKRTGRGLKTLTAPVIKPAALELGLPLHQIDTFTGWNPPEYRTHGIPSINLVVAVSFGLLIPPRILNNAKYSGLNVHPSLLPDLRGAAPIQWTIIYGRTTTGVSLQTLHPRKFDEGVILDQTPAPGLRIPNPDIIDVTELTHLLAPVGAKMLVDAVRNRLYIPPYTPVQQHSGKPAHVSYAPKITPQMCAVDFNTLTAEDILRRGRAIKPLYALAERQSEPGCLTRINFGTDMRAPSVEDVPEGMRAETESIPNGLPYAIIDMHETVDQSSKPLLVNTLSSEKHRDHRVVFPRITVSSFKRGYGAAAAARAGLFTEPLIYGKYKLYRFSQPLSVQPASGETKPAVGLAQPHIQRAKL
ncbi:hypothetical protein A1O1_07746 [Capronia coronata CBS 617.96]|uniref:methionyl-tRNA formyltransferase n=1 Tax=Capronia coronata CBS 617.96 TaxID=1182541 RepID=W9XXG8_9EURO|nr:uncharacterized protein A1O1_07746 [Capronia coronata CBS 617.96]EXJ81681.1 hypothetical protein A1O1_07746 [Capronia coronata CBS 617.96]